MHGEALGDAAVCLDSESCVCGTYECITVELSILIEEHILWVADE